MLQDIKIKNGAVHVEARAFFDSGSNQVLIRDGFGIDNKLRSQHVKYCLRTVGGGYNVVEGKLWEVEITTMNG